MAVSVITKKKGMDGHGELGLLGENFEPGLVGRMREDGYESRSGSDNYEPGSGDDQDPADGNGSRPKRKKYHRHTPRQIQELESFFKECPHPDEKQRSELSRRLGLESKQIKFWFQNRRTQMKTQLERHENVILRQENDKLRAENDMLKHAIASPICNSCGGQAVPGDISYEHHQLKINNARLREEVNRLSSLTNKFLGKPLSSTGNRVASQGFNSNLELGVGRNGFGGATLPRGFEFGDGSMMQPIARPMVNEMLHDKSAIVDIALSAMDELIKMAQMDTPLWIKSSNDGIESLNIDEYRRTFSSCIGMKPSGYATEATRATGLVYLHGSALVESFMDANRWVEMFPCMVSRASTVEVLSNGTGVTGANELQLMDAELQVLTPLVPIRRVRFIRFCKQHSEGVWAVVDVSVDAIQDASTLQIFPNCRRLPSGCVIQDVDNKCSKVTWIEHSEYDDSSVHHSLRPLLSSGFGFGAHRWLAALQRQCDNMVMVMSQGVPSENNTGITLSGKKNMLKLAQRMTYCFCSGVCVSSNHKWEMLSGSNVGEDIRALTRKNISDPGEPEGIILSAAISVWMPTTQQRLFDFLRDEHMRSEWDILSCGGPMQEMVHVAKGTGHSNYVSILRPIAVNPNHNNMVVVQETWSDASGALIVYAPADISSMSVVMNGGGDPDGVSILPCGFAILPCISPNGPSLMNPEIDGSRNGGCLLTVGFQILVNNLPTSKLNMESVQTVSNLISRTIQRIKAGLTVK